MERAPPQWCPPAADGAAAELDDGEDIGEDEDEPLETSDEEFPFYYTRKPVIDLTKLSYSASLFIPFHRSSAEVGEKPL